MIRTQDVVVSALQETETSFDSLLLSPLITQGLRDAGFAHPSPIQLKAIPAGRLGADLVAQAKSGTGKTCVFAVLALELVAPTVHTLRSRLQARDARRHSQKKNKKKQEVHASAPAVLMLSPTREIALQTQRVVRQLGEPLLRSKHDALQRIIHLCIGGTSLRADRAALSDTTALVTPLIVIGTPGRVRALMGEGVFRTEQIQLLVLDEADALFAPSFLQQTRAIVAALPTRRQTLLVSATFPPVLLEEAIQYVRQPQFVRLSSETSDLSLLGVRQYALFAQVAQPTQGAIGTRDVFEAKEAVLLRLLATVPFHQCIIFNNDRIRARELVEVLQAAGWPAAELSAELDQEGRNRVMAQLRKFRVRILVSTDLVSRGIDIERISLVVNFDIPPRVATYLHRIGRTGRYGSLGVAVNLVAVPAAAVVQEEDQEKRQDNVSGAMAWFRERAGWDTGIDRRAVACRNPSVLYVCEDDGSVREIQSKDVASSASFVSWGAEARRFRRFVDMLDVTVDEFPLEHVESIPSPYLRGAKKEMGRDASEEAAAKLVEAAAQRRRRRGGGGGDGGHLHPRKTPPCRCLSSAALQAARAYLGKQ